MAATPRWYTTPDVVVVGANEVTVVTGRGEDREVASVRTPGNRPLPTDLIARLSNVDAAVVVDYAGYAVTDGAPGDTVHPWSAAGLHAYAWVAGGAPAAATDIVLSAPTAHRPGDRITVLTARGAGRSRSAACCAPTHRPPCTPSTGSPPTSPADGSPRSR